MEDHNSEQLVEAMVSADCASARARTHESYSYPSSLAEHFEFSDATRTLREFACRMRAAGNGYREYRYLEVNFSKDEKSALDKAKRLSVVLNELANWLVAKVDTHRTGSKCSGVRPYSGGTRTKDFGSFGKIIEYCGNDFLWGYVHRNENIRHVCYEDFWYKVVVPGSFNS